MANKHMKSKNIRLEDCAIQAKFASNINVRMHLNLVMEYPDNERKNILKIEAKIQEVEQYPYYSDETKREKIEKYQAKIQEIRTQVEYHIQQRSWVRK